MSLSTIIRDIKELDIMPSTGNHCIEYENKYYKLGPGDLVHEGNVVASVDELENGLYTFILFVDSSFRIRPFTRAFTKTFTVGADETDLNELSVAQHLVDACCQNEKSACDRLIPYLRIGVAKCHTLWENVTKHSSIVLGSLNKNDFIIAAGEMMKTDDSAVVNAFSGTYALPVLEKLAAIINIDSNTTKLRLVNSLYLNCVVVLLNAISKKTRINPTSDVLITKENTMPYVRDRLTHFFESGRPVYRFNTSAECNRNVALEKIRITVKIKRLIAKRSLLQRIKRTVDTTDIDNQITQLEAASRELDRNLAQNVWDGW